MSESSINPFLRPISRFFVVANAIVALIVLYAALLGAYRPELYYATVQEDQYLEWATFWAFLLASFGNVLAARRYRQLTGLFPWFLPGVAIFCFLVAMEEISWGQRVLGYRPPSYFLEQNFQQELNIHNVIDTDFRQLALQLVLLVYGIGLPIAANIRKWIALLERTGIVAPAFALVPVFTAALILYLWYPWSHSGEWVEMIMALGFLFSAQEQNHRFSVGGKSGNLWSPLRGAGLIASSVLVVILGIVSVAVSWAALSADPALLTATRAEIAALKSDFESEQVESVCNLHKRVFTFVEEYGQDYLYHGNFASLEDQEVPEDRIGFFIDPWNSPYWIRIRCDDKTGETIRFVYSFGPNRRRDSTRFEPLGDDVGAVIRITGQ